MVGRRWILAISLAFLVCAGAPASTDPSTWPVHFDGTTSLGPWTWLDGPTALRNDPGLASAVQGGSEGSTKLYVCRARLQDGIHPGKFFNGQCNIGWAGQEIVKRDGYELLINTKPDLGRYLSQRWVTAQTSTAATFTGGSVGNAPLRVCQAAYINGWHPGKEWAGKCNIGYGGKEVAEGVYQVLSLGFDKNSWMVVNATQVTLPGTTTSGGDIIFTPPPTMPKTSPSPFELPKDPGVRVTHTIQNGFWMRERTTNRCYGVIQNRLVDEYPSPRNAPGLVWEGALLYLMPVTSDCMNDPRTWFVREDMSTQPSVWFRLRYFQTDLCLQPRGNQIVEGASVVLARCGDTKAQWWTIHPDGDALVSGHSILQGVVSEGQSLTGMGLIDVSKEQLRNRLFMLIRNSAYHNTQVVERYFTPLFFEQAAEWRYEADKPVRIMGSAP